MVTGKALLTELPKPRSFDTSANSFAFLCRQNAIAAPAQINIAPQPNNIKQAFQNRYNQVSPTLNKWGFFHP
jgi:hypothetical protein